LLHGWARAQGLSLPLHVAPKEEGGREHDVRFDDASKRWLKFTKPSAAGYAVHMIEGRLLMTPAQPLQYLERWKLHNRLFFDDVELVGLRTEGHFHRIVVSQQDWGSDAPTWEELEQSMLEDYRLERLTLNELLGGYEARAYMLKHFAVFDVRPINCARSARGIIVPFDVIPQVFRPANAAALRRLGNLPKR
jgi:hypothetical protein